jgi:hypothetical protein
MNKHLGFAASITIAFLPLVVAATPAVRLPKANHVAASKHVSPARALPARRARRAPN